MRPHSAQAPHGFYINGVRPTGHFELRRIPLGRDDDAPQPPGVLQGRIWCGNGERAIVVNERTVGCQR